MIRARGGDAGGAGAGRRARILAVVGRIPRGRVASYGQVAALAGLPRHAREVGRVLSGLDEGTHVPWQRVVNAAGRVSPRGLFGDEGHQRRLLEGEGVVFDARGRIDLDRFGWDPDRRPRTRRSSRHEGRPIRALPRPR